MTAGSHRALKAKILESPTGALNFEKHPLYFAQYNLGVIRRMIEFMRRTFGGSEQFSPPTIFNPQSYARCVALATGKRKK